MPTCATQTRRSETHHEVPTIDVGPVQVEVKREKTLSADRVFRDGPTVSILESPA